VEAGLTLAQKRAMAVALNDERRQMSAEDRMALVLKLREQGLSTRAIAERAGTSQTTVRRDLESAGEPDGSATTITGRDGKTYPAQRPPAGERGGPGVGSVPLGAVLPLQRRRVPLEELQEQEIF
jgi:hypothetical protein